VPDRRDNIRAVTRLSTLGAAVIACTLLLGCGSGSHATAQTKARCPAGETLIEGHSHYQACVPLATARVALVCAETGYELEVILKQIAPQPGAIRSEFEQAARESAATMGATMAALRATGEDATPELNALSQHRGRMLSFASEVQRARNVPEAFARWFKPFLARDPVSHPCRS
jgi:hypothetical protein